MGSRLAQLSFLTAALGAAGGLLVLSLPHWREYRAGTGAGSGSASLATTTRPASRPVRAVVPATPTALGETGTAGVDLRLLAARGRCWVVVRTASSTGTIRYVGILERGRSLHVDGPHLWVSLGAAGNLDVTLNGRGLGVFPTGTIELLVTPDGIRRARRSARSGTTGGAAA